MSAARVITLDAARWKTLDDFYVALLAALGAPATHGHNLDALCESVFEGDINAINPPFRIHVTGAANLNAELRAHLRRVRKAFEEESERTGVDASLTANASLDF